jgi:hypothetical protein
MGVIYSLKYIFFACQINPNIEFSLSCVFSSVCVFLNETFFFETSKILYNIKK